MKSGDPRLVGREKRKGKKKKNKKKNKDGAAHTTDLVAMDNGELDQGEGRSEGRRRGRIE